MNKEHSAQFAADVRKAITDTINSEAVFWRVAPESYPYPYIIFNVRGYADGKSIELDLWDLRDNELRISDTADTIEAELDGLVIANDYHSSILMTDSNKQWIWDEDENILHINMSFTSTYQA